MKRCVAFCLLIILLLVHAAVANSETDNIAYVKASTSDRVHLRAGRSTSSASLGLYFTGTPVFIIENYLKDNWAYVMIGSEKGYIRSDLIVSADNDVLPQWKIAQVRSNGGVNLRTAPTKEAPVLERVEKGAKVIVLGETLSSWYYVKAGSNYGYVMARYLRMIGQEVSKDTCTLSGFPFDFPTDFVFLSGAGAWSTQMTVLSDGRFWGYYHDTEAGIDGDDYPYGTKYECSFTGTFANIKRISQYEYQFQIQNLQSFGIVGQETIVDKMRIITAEPYGLLQNETFSIYLSTIPDNQLPDQALSWRRGYIYSQEIPSILYGHTGEVAWRVE